MFEELGAILLDSRDYLNKMSQNSPSGPSRTSPTWSGKSRGPQKSPKKTKLTFLYLFYFGLAPTRQSACLTLMPVPSLTLKTLANGEPRIASLVEMVAMEHQSGKEKEIATWHKLNFMVPTNSW